MKPGAYTLVDFWASWCPYCIKELPEITALYDRWKDNGLEIVGVAVRDTPDDSKAAVKKHNITSACDLQHSAKTLRHLRLLRNSSSHSRRFNGKIVSRDESISQIEARLKEAAAKQ